MALRLGLRQVKGLKRAEAERLVAARQAGGRFADPRALWRRAGLEPATLDALAGADGFRSMGLDRRAAAWSVKALGPAPLPLFAGLEREAPEREVRLPVMALGEHVVEDYASLSLSLKRHPLALLRAGLDQAGYAPTRRLAALRHGTKAAVAGLVLVRQRPGSAKGVIFTTIEDETGVANLVVLPPVFETYRKPLLAARLLGASGKVERQGEVIHLKVDRLYDLSWRLGELVETEAEPGFSGSMARADEVRRPTRDQREPELQKARNFR
jgi:error-prone DNA polymerase